MAVELGETWQAEVSLKARRWLESRHVGKRETVSQVIILGHKRGRLESMICCEMVT